MPIKFVCSCGTKYRLDESFAGRMVQCRHCNRQMLVPHPLPRKGSPTATDADETQNREVKTPAPRKAKSRKATQFQEDPYGFDSLDKLDFGEGKSEEKSPGSERSSPARKESNKRNKRNRTKGNGEGDVIDETTLLNDLLWGLGFFVGGIASYFYFAWLENRNEEAENMPRFIEFVYETTGKWGVSIVLVFISGLFWSNAWAKYKRR